MSNNSKATSRPVNVIHHTETRDETVSPVYVRFRALDVDVSVACYGPMAHKDLHNVLHGGAVERIKNILNECTRGTVVYTGEERDMEGRGEPNPE